MSEGLPCSRDLACVVHVHSTWSDGTATVPELAAAAARADADAVLLTDHDSLEAKRRGEEGWHGRVLVLVGEEISPSVGHYLAFGVEEEVEHDGRSEREIARAVRDAGGIGFPAHPFSEGARISKRVGRPHAWRDLDTDLHTGVELWSLCTDAAEGWARLGEAIAFLRHPERAFDGPPRRNLEAWDRLCLRRRVVAIGGLDAHQSGLRVGGRVLSPLRNERIFQLLRTHVLVERPPTGDLASDREMVYAALREGRCYLAVDSLAPGRGFQLWAEGPEGRLPMGAEAPAGRWTIRARVPAAARLSLVCDGRVVRNANAVEALDTEVGGAGVYRVEARLRRGGRERLWILSNPIYLR